MEPDTNAVPTAGDEQPIVDDGTPTPQGDQAPVAEPQSEGNPSADSFTSIDPSTLPPELQDLYKSMQGDYTKKTQGLADVRKSADAYEALMSNPNLVKALEAVANPQPAAEATPPEPQMTGEQLLMSIYENPENLREIIRSEAQKMIDPLSQSLTKTELSEQVNELTAKYPDFLEHQDSILSAMQGNPNLSLEQAYQLSTWDKVKQKGINEGVEASKKRNNNAAPPTSTTPTAKTGRMSIDEAFAEAMSSQGL